jgi:uncharacterized protein YbjQ (UPF0145 family)
MKMKTFMLAFSAALAVSSAFSAAARDEHLMFPIKSALEKGKHTKNSIDPKIRLHFGKQGGPAVAKTIGEWTASRKTNTAHKSDQEACEIAFVSAVVSLQERARNEGGDAVINIRSVYRNEHRESPSQYLCGAGTFVAGVGLRGTVVKLKK